MEFGNLYVKVIYLYLCEQIFIIFIINVVARKSVWQVAIIKTDIPLMLLRTSPGSVVARAIKCCTVATDICGSSVQNLLRVTLPNPLQCRT